MQYEYSAENHDWDLTLRAAWNLGNSTLAAQASNKDMNNSEQIFSYATGSMLLSFCAIESFTNSIAFLMDGEDRFKHFSYEDYRKSRWFWSKVESVCSALDYKIDKSAGLFDRLTKMQNWRNSLVHSSSYEIEETLISDTKKDTQKLHMPFWNKEYARIVNAENTKLYYETACEYIALIKSLSGLNPQARCTYKGVADTED